MQLNDPQRALLRLLEARTADGVSLRRDDPYARAVDDHLVELESVGLATTTVDHWVITPSGRRALGAYEDGTPRLTVDRWGAASRGGPS